MGIREHIRRRVVAGQEPSHLPNSPQAMLWFRHAKPASSQGPPHVVGGAR